MMTLHERCLCDHPVIDHAAEYGGCRRCHCTSNRSLVWDPTFVEVTNLLQLKRPAETKVRVNGKVTTLGEIKGMVVGADSAPILAVLALLGHRVEIEVSRP